MGDVFSSLLVLVCSVPADLLEGSYQQRKKLEEGMCCCWEFQLSVLNLFPTWK